jgi:hypothetical protein
MTSATGKALFSTADEIVERCPICIDLTRCEDVQAPCSRCNKLVRLAFSS